MEVPLLIGRVFLKHLAALLNHGRQVGLIDIKRKFMALFKMIRSYLDNDFDKSMMCRLQCDSDIGFITIKCRITCERSSHCFNFLLPTCDSRSRKDIAVNPNTRT